MARVLEALKHAEHGLARPAVPLRQPLPPARAERTPEPEMEVPYIEIGGPGTSPEASALVRASGPLPLPRLPTDSARSVTAPLRPHVCAADSVKPIPLGVQFHSLVGD